MSDKIISIHTYQNVRYQHVDKLSGGGRGGGASVYRPDTNTDRLGTARKMRSGENEARARQKTHKL